MTSRTGISISFWHEFFRLNKTKKVNPFQRECTERGKTHRSESGYLPLGQQRHPISQSYHRKFLLRQVPDSGPGWVGSTSRPVTTRSTTFSSADVSSVMLPRVTNGLIVVKYLLEYKYNHKFRVTMKQWVNGLGCHVSVWWKQSHLIHL